MYSENLASWKEIACFLGKGVRTVQRWEAQLGLPVHRPNARVKGVVSASREELERWMETRWCQRSERPVHVSALGDQNLKGIREVIATSQQMRAQRQEVLKQFRAARIRLLVELQASIEVVYDRRYNDTEQQLRKAS